MGIASDIKQLGEDIIDSYDVRVKAIGQLEGDVHKMLKGFQTEHKEMAANLNDFLAKGEKDRLAGFKAMMADTQKFISNLTKEVSSMIKRFQKEHKEMADELKDSLAKGETDRLKAFKPMMNEIQKGIKGIEAYVKNRLKEFSDAHADMSEKLKKELAKYVNDMVKATKKLMGDIQARQKERNTEVADLLEAFNTEREKMAANWQSLTATMTKKRGGKPVKVEAGGGAKTVKEVVEKKKGKKKAAKEEVKEEGTTGEILSILEDYPDGATLSEIADEMDVHFASLIRPMGELVDDGKVEKVDNRYLLT